MSSGTVTPKAGTNPKWPEQENFCARIREFATRKGLLTDRGAIDIPAVAQHLGVIAGTLKQDLHNKVRNRPGVEKLIGIADIVGCDHREFWNPDPSAMGAPLLPAVDVTARFPEVFRRRLKEYRRATGLSNDAVARELQTTGGTLRWWAAGVRPPRLENLFRIAAVFGCSIVEFIEDPALDGLSPAARDAAIAAMMSVAGSLRSSQEPTPVSPVAGRPGKARAARKTKGRFAKVCFAMLCALSSRKVGLLGLRRKVTPAHEDPSCRR